eukprot:COSAG01_NODE_15393_length_1343_cov_1.685691_2_plen_174_part_00
MGRALFKTGTWDDYAFMMWLHGPSRTGKTLANFILSHFFQDRAVTTVGTQSETKFGKQALVGMEFIWFTDPKAPKGFSGFPMDISELQELIEGARTDVARKKQSRLTNVLLNGALTADSNKRPNLSLVVAATSRGENLHSGPLLYVFIYIRVRTYYAYVLRIRMLLLYVFYLA